MLRALVAEVKRWIPPPAYFRVLRACGFWILGNARGSGLLQRTGKRNGRRDGIAARMAKPPRIIR